MDGKVDLERRPWTHFHSRKMGPRPSVITRSLPYVNGKLRGRVHRVRNGLVHWRWDGHHHISVGVWCNQAPSHPRFLPPGSGYEACPTCEERAAKAGLPASQLPYPRI